MDVPTIMAQHMWWATAQYWQVDPNPGGDGLPLLEGVRVELEPLKIGSISRRSLLARKRESPFHHHPSINTPKLRHITTSGIACADYETFTTKPPRILLR